MVGENLSVDWLIPYIMVECSYNDDILVKVLPLVLRVWVYLLGLESPDNLENITSSFFPCRDVSTCFGVTWGIILGWIWIPVL